MGLQLMAEGKFKEACKSLSDALDVATELEDNEGIGKCNYYLGNAEIYAVTNLILILWSDLTKQNYIQALQMIKKLRVQVCLCCQCYMSI